MLKYLHPEPISKQLRSQLPHPQFPQPLQDPWVPLLQDLPLHRGLWLFQCSVPGFLEVEPHCFNSMAFVFFYSILPTDFPAQLPPHSHHEFQVREFPAFPKRRRARHILPT